MTSNVYQRYCRYLAPSDRAVFSFLLERAVQLVKELKDVPVNVDELKKNTPVVYASTLSKRSSDDDVISRKDVNSDRARRKFLMIDADFNPGQEGESACLRDRIVCLCRELKTPVLIYPTVSFPVKPRFRAVFFTERVMTSDQYWSAMTWLYRELDQEPLDPSDLRMSANRNAPIFFSEEQVAAVYSTLDDESLKPLSNALWRDIKRPKRRVAEPSVDVWEFDGAWSVSKLILGSKKLSRQKIAMHYETFWRIVESIAVEVFEKAISVETAEDMVRMLADGAGSPGQRDVWARGNVKMLRDCVRSMDESKAHRARPLVSYTEYLPAFVI